LKQNNNILLIELCGSHDECLYSQALIYNYLGKNVHIIASDNLSGRFGNYTFVKSFNFYKVGLGRLEDIKTLLKVKLKIAEINPEQIIFNTASNSIIMDLLIILGKKYNYSGIIHSLKKLTEGLTQKVISFYIRKYFVLNDYLLNYIPQKLSQHKFQSIYTVFSAEIISQIKMKDDEFRICIPGHFEYKRRDYKFLLDLVANSNLNKNVKFVILGNASHTYSDGKDFIKIVNEKKLEHRFEFFHSFISIDIYNSQISNSDLLMALLHPNVPYFPDYLNNQISGTFNLSFSHKIPMLINIEFQDIADIKENSFFYDINECVEKINYLADNKEVIIQKKEFMKNYNIFNLLFQSNKVKEFLGI